MGHVKSISVFRGASLSRSGHSSHSLSHPVSPIFDQYNMHSKYFRFPCIQALTKLWLNHHHHHSHCLSYQGCHFAINKLVLEACVGCHGTKCPLLTAFSLSLSFSRRYFSPRRSNHGVPKFCMGF